MLKIKKSNIHGDGVFSSQKIPKGRLIGKTHVFKHGGLIHITILGKEKMPLTHKYDVTGSLCENNDKFAIDRMLPPTKEGDILVIHDTGAHGHAMGFNYNGKLRSAELLLRRDGSVVQIRRAETPDDYFATLDFNGLKKFK